jgi:hypothetical protein
MPRIFCKAKPIQASRLLQLRSAACVVFAVFVIVDMII